MLIGFLTRAKEALTRQWDQEDAVKLGRTFLTMAKRSQKEQCRDRNKKFQRSLAKQVKDATKGTHNLYKDDGTVQPTDETGTGVCAGEFHATPHAYVEAKSKPWFGYWNVASQAMKFQCSP